jgi:hypothetical protein
MSVATSVESPPLDVSLHLLGAEGVLFDARSQSLYALNTTAAFIWCCLEDRQPEDVIASNLGVTFNLDAAAAAAYVRDILTQWSAFGLFTDAAPEIAAREPAWPCGITVPATHRKTRWQAHWTIRLLDSVFSLRVGSTTALRRLQPVLAPLVTSDTHKPAITLDIVPAARLIAVRSGADILIPGIRPSALAPALKVLLLRRALEQCREYGAVHGAAVGRDGSCILFPGVSGAGKSTLVATLLASGCRLLGDDTIVLSYDDLTARPVPFGICLKPGAVGLLASHFPALADLPTHDRLDGKRVRYLVPPVSSRAGADDRYQIAAIVLLNRREGASAALRTASKADVLRQLMDGFCPLRETLTRPEIERLVRWIESVPCFELEYGTLDAAARNVMTLLP